MKNNQVNIDFVEWRSDGSGVELEFTENEEEMDIFKFRDFCVRFALAMNYTIDSVKAAFGENIEV